MILKLLYFSSNNSYINLYVDMDIQSFPIHPNLEDTIVFSLQHRHRSSTIYVDPNVLTC